MSNIVQLFSAKRKNPNWLLRIARAISNLRSLIADYRHFRAQGLTRKAARFNALNTPTLSARKISR